MKGSSSDGKNRASDTTIASGSRNPRKANTAAPLQTPRVARSRARAANRVPTPDVKLRPVVRASSRGRASSPVRTGTKRAAA